jgi:long-subunit acyl-CoA synthetase (AMP-forming)
MAATTTIPAGALGGRVKFVPGSLGLLLPNLEARIVREDGSEAGFNEPGELFIRGPSIALGYWRKEKATSETFLPDGWLRSGDQFRVDEDGNFLCASTTSAMCHRG